MAGFNNSFQINDKENRDGLVSVAVEDRTRSDSFKLQWRKFMLEVKGTF